MSRGTTNSIRWTTADLDLLEADEWKRYEIIDGELFVTRAPHLGHQDAAGQIYAELLLWSRQTGLGKPFLTPGVIFTDADNVIPDVIWVSQARLATIVDDEGHLTAAPELVVEVLSPGSTNERRDREAKLKLYSLKGVQEYWIVDWRSHQLEMYRRHNAQLQLVGTLLSTDDITSPLLPEFRCAIAQFFAS
jgi:Uma2 family endonuclease